MSDVFGDLQSCLGMQTATVSSIFEHFSSVSNRAVSPFEGRKGNLGVNYQNSVNFWWEAGPLEISIS